MDGSTAAVAASPSRGPAQPLLPVLAALPSPRVKIVANTKATAASNGAVEAAGSKVAEDAPKKAFVDAAASSDSKSRPRSPPFECDGTEALGENCHTEGENSLPTETGSSTADATLGAPPTLDDAKSQDPFVALENASGLDHRAFPALPSSGSSSGDCSRGGNDGAPRLIVEGGKVKKVVPAARPDAISADPSKRIDMSALLDKVTVQTLKSIRASDMSRESILNAYFPPISEEIVEKSLAMVRECKSIYGSKIVKSLWRGVVRRGDAWQIERRYGKKKLICKGFEDDLHAAAAYDGIQRFLCAGSRLPNQIEFNFPVLSGEQHALLAKVSAARKYQQDAQKVATQKVVAPAGKESGRKRSSRLQYSAERKRAEMLARAAKFPPYPSARVPEMPMDGFVESIASAMEKQKARKETRVRKRSRSGRTIKPVAVFTLDSDSESQHSARKKAKKTRKSSGSGDAFDASSSRSTKKTKGGKKRKRKELPWPESHLALAGVKQVLSKLDDADRVKLWDPLNEKLLAGNCTPLKKNLLRLFKKQTHLRVYMGQNFDDYDSDDCAKPLSRNHYIRATNPDGYRKILKKKRQKGETQGKPAKKRGKGKKIKVKMPSAAAEASKAKKKPGRPKKVKLNYKINFKDMLKSPNSILTAIDMREIINPSTIAELLSRSERCALYSLLPDADLNVSALESLGRSHMHFGSSLFLYQQLLMQGSFDRDIQNRIRAKIRRQSLSKGEDPEKAKQYEVVWGCNIDHSPATADEVNQYKDLDEAFLVSMGIDESVRAAAEAASVEARSRKGSTPKRAHGKINTCGTMMTKGEACGLAAPCPIHTFIPEEGSTRTVAWLEAYMASPEVAAALKDKKSKDRIPLWNVAKEMKVSGQSVPIFANLPLYLLRKPQYEVYIGQKKKSETVSAPNESGGEAGLPFDPIDGKVDKNKEGGEEAARNLDAKTTTKEATVHESVSQSDIQTPVEANEREPVASSASAADDGAVESDTKKHTQASPTDADRIDAHQGAVIDTQEMAGQAAACENAAEVGVEAPQTSEIRNVVDMETAHVSRSNENI